MNYISIADIQMKLMCINNARSERLTMGKIYDNYAELESSKDDGSSVDWDEITEDNEYCILDDRNCVGWFPKGLFRPMDEHRNNLINSILT